MWHVWEKSDERRPLERHRRRREQDVGMDVKSVAWAWTELIWLVAGTSGPPLCVW